MRYIYLILLCSFASLMGCFEEFEVEVKNIKDETKIVAEVLYFSDLGWKAQVFKTTPISNSGSQDDTVSLKYIHLYEDNSLVDSFQIHSDTIICNYKAKVNRQYRLEILTQDDQTLTSKSCIYHPPAEIDSIYEGQNSVFVNWKSPIGIQYYTVKKEERQEYPFNEPNLIGLLYEDDKEFEHNKVIPLKIYSDTSLITLYTVSEDIARYLKSLDEYRQSYDEGFVDPKKVYTNFENGIGIFGLFAASETKTFIKED